MFIFQHEQELDRYTNVKIIHLDNNHLTFTSHLLNIMIEVMRVSLSHKTMVQIETTIICVTLGT